MTNNPFKRTTNNRRHHYCQILGIGDKATKREICEAFWGLRKKFHRLEIWERERRVPTETEARSEEISKFCERKLKGEKEISESLEKNWKGVKGYDKLNEETKQLFKAKFKEAFQVSPHHFHNCLKIHQEVEESVQRIIKIIEEINEEVCRAGIIVEESKRLKGEDEEVNIKLSNDLQGLSSKDDKKIEHFLADIEKLKNKGKTYEEQKDKIAEKKDELAQEDPSGYAKMIARVIQKKIDEFKVEVARLGQEIKEKLIRLQNSEFTNDKEVREIEEEVSNEVSGEVANIELSNLMTQAQKILKGSVDNLKSQLKKAREDLYSFSIGKNISRNDNAQQPKSSFFRPEVIVPLGLVSVLGVVAITAVSEKKLEGIQKSLEGELTINNFPNLEKIFLSNNQITKLIFQNCPQIKEINVYRNKLTKLEISGLPELEYLHCGNNQLNKLDVSENTKLKTLFYFNNPFESQLENLIGVEKLVDLEGLRGKGLIKKMEEEIKIHLDAMKRMDDFYRQNPPSEDTKLTNILQEISNEYLIISCENRQKELEIKELKEIVNNLEKLVIHTKDSFLVEKIENKYDLLEAQRTFIKSDNEFVRSQIVKFKQRLLNSGQVNQNELQKVCRIQAELSFLELKLEQEQKFQTQIEIRIDKNATEIDIKNAYTSEALKGIDNKKRRNKESEKGNNSANNQENFVQESEESENNNKQELTIHKRDHDDNEQFYEELAFYTLECSLCGGCKSWLCGIYGHVVHCLKTRQEIEELHQKKVKEVDKIRKNRGCIRCYQEQNRSIPDNNQLTLTSNEKRDSSEQSLTISDQESQRGEINNNTNNQRNEQLENNFNLTISEQKPQANELLKIVISGELLIKKKQFNREILTKLITEKKNNPSLLSTLK
ncbi:12686_t:CDS:10 [Funneliformis geosporum]|nr:12686_t:CDS:10 [Funneliformis geosporum]